MNNLHPDVHFDIHRSYQKERLEKSLQEKPESTRAPIQLSRAFVFVSLAIALAGGYFAFV
jgi:hypothetical protein